MKKLSLFIMLAFVLAACNSKSKTSSQNEQEKPTIDQVAQNQCKKLFKEIAKDPESVQLSDFRTVYKTDSLCILHLTFTAKNGFGFETSDKMEYIYYIDQSDKYEAYINIDDNDSIYLNEEELTELKRRTFYECLSYSEALKYRVENYLNKNGKVIDNPEKEISIKAAISTGDWSLSYYKDEFGDYSNKTYISLVGTGVFSNSATTNSRMSAILFVDEESVSLRLVEYDSYIVKDEDDFFLKIKDTDGNITKFDLHNTRSGIMYFTNSSYWGNRYDQIVNILDKEGEIKCSGELVSEYGSRDSYTFSFDLTGYREALQYVK